MLHVGLAVALVLDAASTIAWTVSAGELPIVALVLFVIRALALPVFCLVAWKMGKELQRLLAQRHACLQPRTTKKEETKEKEDDEEDDEEELVGFAVGSEGHSLLSNDTESANTTDDNAAEIKANRALRFLIGGAFVLSAVSQICVGLSTVSLAESVPVLQIVSLCAVIVFVNAQLFLCRAYLESQLVDEGIFLGTVHNHKVQYMAQFLYYASCDVCEQTVEPPYYHCDLCSFDACVSCLREKLRTAESSSHLRPQFEEAQSGSMTSFLRDAFVLLKPHMLYIFVAFVLLLGKQALSVASPYFTGSIVDSILTRSVDSFKNQVFWLCIIGASLGVVSGASDVLFRVISARLEVDLKSTIFTRFLDQPLEFFDESKIGDMQARISTDTEHLVEPLAHSVPLLGGAIIGFIGSLVMILITSWRLSILSFSFLFPAAIASLWYYEWATTIMYRVWAVQGALSDIARESFSMIRTIRVFSQEENMRRLFSSRLEERMRMTVKDAFGNGGVLLLQSFLEEALQILLVGYGGYLILFVPGTNLTIGKLVMFQLYFGFLESSFATIADNAGQFARLTGAAERVFAVLRSVGEVDTNVGIPVSQIGEIELKNVSFSYKSRPNNPVLQNVKLSIPKNKVVAFVGRSGGGKSTLISLLAGLYEPSGGDILVDGVSLSAVQRKSYRNLVGLVSQDTEVFNRTIESNIAFGARGPYTQDELLDACKKAGCHDFVMQFPDGYLTKVGERGAKLSGGQRQRIALARVLLRRPQLLLLDESTSALDAEAEAHVQKTIDQLIQDRKVTVVLVAHRLSTVQNCDKIFVVDKGQIVEEGTHTELLDRKGLYWRLVHKQVQKMANTLDEHNLKQSVEATIDELLEEEEEAIQGKQKEDE